MATSDYFYEHTNGTIHRKPAIVVNMGGGPGEYFASPMVRRWWRDTTVGVPEGGPPNDVWSDNDPWGNKP